MKHPAPAPRAPAPRALALGALALALSACGGHGAAGIAPATSQVYAANTLVGAANGAIGAVTRFGYGLGFPWGTRYQQPYTAKTQPGGDR